MMEIKTFYSDEIEEIIPDLARLRITVFHDYPYLYEGDFDYEKNYLKIYTDTDESAIVVAIDQNKIVGAASALPLKDEADYVIEPFLKASINIQDVFYFGESVLLKDYRGHGIGHKFFDEREKAAKKFGYKKTAFCGVVRSNHPLMPKNYKPLDEFWIKRGYAKQPHLRTQFSWKDIGDEKETYKEMIYWMKELK